MEKVPVKRSSFVSPNKWYKLDYSPFWDWEVFENIPAFFDPLHGKGALQIFSLKITQKPSPKILKESPYLEGKNLKEKMELFLKYQEVSPKVENFFRGDMEVAACEYTKGGRFYMACMFQKKDIFLFAIYNCHGYPPKEEAEEVVKILQSIEILR